MRTTIDIDDDVLNAAKELARIQGTSAGAVVSNLLRQALAGSGTARGGRRASTGFRAFPSGGRVVSPKQIDTLRDAEGV